MTGVAKLGPWIEKNSWPIVAALSVTMFGMMGSYLAGADATTEKFHRQEIAITEIKASLQAIDARLEVAGADRIRGSEAGAEHRLLHSRIDNLERQVERLD